MLFLTPVIAIISCGRCCCLAWRVWWHMFAFVTHEITWHQTYVALLSPLLWKIDAISYQNPQSCYNNDYSSRLCDINGTPDEKMLSGVVVILNFKVTIYKSPQNCINMHMQWLDLVGPCHLGVMGITDTSISGEATSHRPPWNTHPRANYHLVLCWFKFPLVLLLGYTPHPAIIVTHKIQCP